MSLTAGPGQATVLAAETERSRASAVVAAQRLSARLAARPAGGTA